MSIFIGYRSSFEYWLTNDPPPSHASSRACPLAGKRVNAHILPSLNLPRFGIVEQPVHVIVANANDRSQAKGLTCHVWTGMDISGSFIKLDKELYISCPEQSFVQMASELSLIDLVRFGYELCGTYAYLQETCAGFRKRAPLTTVRSLAKHVAKMRGLHGAKKAIRALRFVADGSASPMETTLTMSLCLSRMLGGYGLNLPELNARIEAHSKALVSRNYFACDLYWRKYRVAVEYDSAEQHSGAEARSRDSSRRSSLLAQNITVISVTTSQFFDARRLDEAARAVAKLTGKNLPENDTGWMMKRHELRTELLKDIARQQLETDC